LIRSAKVTFPGESSGAPILKDLREAAAAALGPVGLAGKANASMVLRTFVMLGVTFGAYAVLLVAQPHPLLMLALAMVVGAGIAGIGFGIAHDALHGSYSSSPRLNRVLGFTFDLCGASSYLWNYGHNVAHHTYTNIPGADGDISSDALLRKTPGAPHRPNHRYQHLYGFPLYSLATVNWAFIKDYKSLFESDHARTPDGGHRKRDVATLLAFKAFFYTWSIVVPLAVLDVAWWQFLIGYLAMHMTAGLILGVVFMMAHVVEGVTFPTPDADGAISDSWVAHELATTANFSNGNRLLTWYVGGLNHQIEHHLFPRLCSVHYPKIRNAVRDVAFRHGLPYIHNPTLLDAIRSHYRFMKRMGAGPAAQAPAAAPAPPAARTIQTPAA
jgi:linoleoyl-CoA desaturase